jgi:hypothetical protein
VIEFTSVAAARNYVYALFAVAEVDHAQHRCLQWREILANWYPRTHSYLPPPRRAARERSVATQASSRSPNT